MKLRNHWLAAGAVMTLLGGFSVATAAPGLVISEYMANPPGTDNNQEYVELVATEDINFATTPYTVIWTNNGTATANGWIVGGTISYAFEITTGTVAAGDIVYVGGNAMAPTGTKIRVKDVVTTTGDGGIGSTGAGVLGNGGGNADSIGVFNVPVASVTDASIPVDAVFFGTSVGTALVSAGADGYVLPSNDKYSGGFLQSTSFLAPDPGSAVATVATGTFNTTSSTWTTPRTFTNGTATATTAVTLISGSNLPPAISNRVQTPTLATTSVLSASVDVTDSDVGDTITGVTAYVATGTAPTYAAGAYSPVSFTGPGAGGTWSGTLGTFATDTVVYYYFDANDSDGGSTAGTLGSAGAPFSTYVNGSRPAAGQLVVNEIMITEGSGQPATDWFELANATASPVNIGNFKFSDSSVAEFTIPLGTTIPANGFLVVTQNATLFSGYAPWSTAPVIGGHAIGLGGGGDAVEIYDDGGNTIDNVVYTAVAPWTGAVNTGHTVELKGVGLDNSLPANWSSSASANVTGTPGAVNFAVPSAPSATGAAATINVARNGSTNGTSVGTVNDNQDLPGSLAITDNAPVGLTISYTNTSGAVTADVAANNVIVDNTYTVTATVTDSDLSTSTFQYTVVVTPPAAISEWMLLND